MTFLTLAPFLFNTTVPGTTSCVFNCSVSHTKADIHTPTLTAERDPVIPPGREEFLFTRLLQLSGSLLHHAGVGGVAEGETVGGVEREQGVR